MGTKTENFNCSEFKLNLINEIINLDCDQIDLNNFTLEPEFYKKLSEEQARCMNEEAAKVLRVPTLKNFVLNAGSFKTITLQYAYVHFVFADKNSLGNFSKINIPNLDHDLYYMVINCDVVELNSFDFSNYEAYIVNDRFEAQSLNGLLTLDIFKKLRREFLNGVGNVIRMQSTFNAITEYVTFSLDVVNAFRNELPEDYDMNIKVISIKKGCNKGVASSQVSRVLNDSRNQDRFSMAFQKIDNEGAYFNYYDIGNMHP